MAGVELVLEVVNVEVVGGGGARGFRIAVMVVFAIALGVVVEVGVVDPIQILLASGDSYVALPCVLKTTAGLPRSMYTQP
mmetsp:Transcript_30541/g.87251  ORF Transcript_30541/g.87251 Transcript_30541/m.87251 type:complete len:80 (-) Transcript_30541:314-553(-)